MDYKLVSEKKQLNLLVKCRNMNNGEYFEKWILSDELLELEPKLLTELLIKKTKFGVGYINPNEEVMKDFKKL